MGSNPVPVAQETGASLGSTSGGSTSGRFRAEQPTAAIAATVKRTGHIRRARSRHPLNSAVVGLPALTPKACPSCRRVGRNARNPGRPSSTPTCRGSTVEASYAGASLGRVCAKQPSGPRSVRRRSASVFILFSWQSITFLPASRLSAGNVSRRHVAAAGRTIYNVSRSETEQAASNLRADADPEQGRRTGARRNPQSSWDPRAAPSCTAPLQRRSRRGVYVPRGWTAWEIPACNQAVEKFYKVTETVGMPENRGV